MGTMELNEGGGILCETKKQKAKKKLYIYIYSLFHVSLERRKMYESQILNGVSNGTFVFLCFYVCASL